MNFSDVSRDFLHFGEDWTVISWDAPSASFSFSSPVTPALCLRIHLMVSYDFLGSMYLSLFFFFCFLEQIISLCVYVHFCWLFCLLKSVEHFSECFISIFVILGSKISMFPFSNVSLVIFLVIHITLLVSLSSSIIFKTYWFKVCVVVPLSVFPWGQFLLTFFLLVAGSFYIFSLRA